ncbi:hypothetical protein P8452_28605 [Trifolium repens]|nr:hypothetical protein P8452_28605 [Trifolium repens]
MSTTIEDFQGVSNCYVFKSRLQEYAQKAGLPTPVYETIKEGPSHEPSFRSTVVVNDIRYDSLVGFLNRKAAEQSAAEVALMELAKSGAVNQSITQPVHETGLCKNLLQEYAQKMNYAMPTYQCKKDDKPGRTHLFSCTVDIGGILYIGGVTKTKKEAEIKAARTALLAIQRNASQSSENQFGPLTVIPSRKRAADSVADEASKAPKPKKSRFKRKCSKRKQSRDKKRRIQAANAGDGANINPEVESVNGESGLQEIKSEAAFPSEAMTNSENGVSNTNINPVVELLASVKGEPGLQEIKSEAAFPSEAMKISENGVSTTSINLSVESLAIVNGESGLQEIKFEAALPSEVTKNPDEAALPLEVTKNPENGVSTTNFNLGVESLESVNGKSVLQEAALPSEVTKNRENGVSTTNIDLVVESLASVNAESGLQEIKSEAALPSEAMEISENGVSTANMNPGVESLASVNGESGLQEIKSEASLPSEAMKNSENGVSTNHHEKETSAGEGSFALNNQKVFENGKSAELQSKEDNLGNVVTEVVFAPNGDMPTMSVEMNEQRCHGDMVFGE